MPQSESSYEELLLVAVTCPLCQRAQLGCVMLMETQHKGSSKFLYPFIQKKGLREAAMERQSLGLNLC